MCLLAISFQELADAPLAVAANREEYFARPTLPPAIQSGEPRVLCGTDARAGGTWLGVNEFGVIVAVTNRRKQAVPSAPRSRGLLCRELLNCTSAADASELAERELLTARYDGANYLCADERSATVLHGGDEIEAVSLAPGLHLLTNGEVDDARDPRQRLARAMFAAAGPAAAADFAAAARRVCSFRDAENSRSIVLRDENRGTVSSTILVLTREPFARLYLHAAGPPDCTAFDDYSGLLVAME